MEIIKEKKQLINGPMYYYHLCFDDGFLLFTGKLNNNNDLEINYTKIPQEVANPDISEFQSDIVQYFIDAAKENEIPIVSTSKSIGNLLKVSQFGFRSIGADNTKIIEFLDIPLRKHGWYYDLSGEVIFAYTFFQEVKKSLLTELGFYFSSKPSFTFSKFEIQIELFFETDRYSLLINKNSEDKQYEILFLDKHFVLNNTEDCLNAMSEINEFILNSQRMNFLFKEQRKHFNLYMDRYFRLPNKVEDIIYEELLKTYRAEEIEKMSYKHSDSNYISMGLLSWVFAFNRIIVVLNNEQILKSFSIKEKEEAVIFSNSWIKEAHMAEAQVKIEKDSENLRELFNKI
jgi:hypothetical protein